MNAARSTRTITQQEWTIPAPGGVLADDVDAIKETVRAEAAAHPDKPPVWMRPAGDSFVIGYSVETTTPAS